MNPDFRRFHAFEFRGTRFLLNIPESCLYELSAEALDAYRRWRDDKVEPAGEAAEQLREVFTEPPGEEEASVALRLENALPRQNLLWLGVTHDCNLRCSYCFVDLKQSPQHHMQAATARTGIDRLVADSGKNEELSIIFFGGEPLLRLDLLADVVGYCREKEKSWGKRFRFNVTTNGVLLTPETFAQLERLGIAVMVSLDGDQPAHDKLRRTREGGPSWDTIIGNLRGIPDFGRKIAARATITALAPDYLHVYRTIEQLGFESIFLTEVCPGPRHSESLREGLESLQQSYLALMDYLFEQATSRGSVALAKLHRFLDALYSRHVSYYGCSTGLLGYYLAPDGRYYPCNRLITPDGRFVLGDIHHGFDEEKRRIFLRNHVLNKPCRECWARYLCGGQCYADSFWASNDIFKLDEFSCAMIRFKIACAAHFLSRLRAIGDN